MSSGSTEDGLVVSRSVSMGGGKELEASGPNMHWYKLLFSDMRNIPCSLSGRRPFWQRSFSQIPPSTIWSTGKRSKKLQLTLRVAIYRILHSSLRCGAFGISSKQRRATGSRAMYYLSKFTVLSGKLGAAISM